MMWQPIETAPKDGSAILAWGAGLGHLIAAFDREYGWGYRWCMLDGQNYSFASSLTHWLPLPAPPATQRGINDSVPVGVPDDGARIWGGA